MKKALICGLLAGASLLGGGQAMATLTSTELVENVYVRADPGRGGEYFFYNLSGERWGYICTGGSYTAGPYAVAKGSKKQKARSQAIFEVVMAAHLTGTPVQFDGVCGSTGFYMEVDSVEMFPSQ